MKINPNAKVIRLPEVVGKGYKTFWNFKGRYRVCKGSRASKKSKTTALNIIKRMMQYPEANTLVVRKVFRTLKDSCFTELKWAINRLGVQAYWEIKESPLEMTYVPTGQKIYFRGLDDPLKVTSITVEIGYLCWCWIEEAYEITNEDDFNMLDESIRGAIPEESGLFKQITLTFNPWNEKHWIRKRFFGEITGKDAQGNPTYQFHDSWTSPDGQIYATTTNYLCNEWLDEADLKVFQTMKETNPRRYKVAGLGGWGIVDGLIFENWREEAFNVKEVSAKAGVKYAFGLDFGYTNDPTALFCGLVSKEEKTIWVFDELYEKALTNRAICDRVTTMGYAKERIKADCAEPKSIDELREAGLRHIRAARKGKDSVNNGIQYIQDYIIIIHPRCVNFITEISNYTWDEDKFGTKINIPIDDFNHLMDAMRYALEDMLVFDAIICNTDRHYGNFGVLVDNKTNTIAAPAPLFDHGNSLFSLGGTDLWDNQKAFDEYARTLLPLAYDDFFAAAKSAMKPRHRTMLHKLLDFHFDRRATRYNLPPNRLKMIEKEVQRRARVLLG